MPKVQIRDVQVRRRHRKDLGDINSLAASIADVGLLQPIVIRPDMSLVAGERRLKAAKQLGWQEILAHVVNNLDEAMPFLRAERDENTCRKALTPSEAVAIAEDHEKRERAEAKRRQAATRAKPGQQAHKRGSGKLPEPKADSRDAIGAAVNMSGQTYVRAKAVVQAAKAEPEKYGQFAEEMDRTGRVNGVYRKLATSKAAESIRAEPSALPQGPFRVIVVDPPWKYDARAEDDTHRAANPYPSMSIDQIKALDVAGMAGRDCVLWLWTTNAHMRVAFDVLDAWGFKFKTILTWVKDRMGTGDWLRGQTEHCLMAVRGKPVIVLENQTTALHGPMRRHSQKPEEFYLLVESLCPGSKLEMFARQKREGWMSHGNESR